MRWNNNDIYFQTYFMKNYNNKIEIEKEERLDKILNIQNLHPTHHKQKNFKLIEKIIDGTSEINYISLDDTDNRHSIIFIQYCSFIIVLFSKDSITNYI